MQYKLISLCQPKKLLFLALGAGCDDRTPQPYCNPINTCGHWTPLSSRASQPKIFHPAVPLLRSSHMNMRNLQTNRRKQL